MTYLESNSIKKDSPLSHKGRFGRLSYLAWTFIVSLLYFCALLVLVAVSAVIVASSSTIFSLDTLFTDGLGYLIALLFFAVIIFFMVLFINLTIRRLHDLNKSGWLCLIMLIPLVNIGFWIYVMCFKGSIGANTYGEPRATEQSEKYLGTIYSVFLGIMMVIYIGLIVALKAGIPLPIGPTHQYDMDGNQVVSDSIPQEDLDQYLAEIQEAAEATALAADAVAE